MQPSPPNVLMSATLMSIHTHTHSLANVANVANVALIMRLNVEMGLGRPEVRPAALISGANERARISSNREFPHYSLALRSLRDSSSNSIAVGSSGFESESELALEFDFAIGFRAGWPFGGTKVSERASKQTQI